MGKEEKAIGIIRGVEITDGTKSDGVTKWERAGIKVENSDGKVFTVATFDEKDIAKANSLNGKEVEVTYTVSGKWNNLSKGGIKSTITEETVEDTKEEKKEEEPTKTKESMQRVNSYQNKEDRKQVLIVRQNSYTQANCVVANLLKAVELGVLEKKNVVNLTTQMIENLAHDIEADIMRE